MREPLLNSPRVPLPGQTIPTSTPVSSVHLAPVFPALQGPPATSKCLSRRLGYLPGQLVTSAPLPPPPPAGSPSDPATPCSCWHQAGACLQLQPTPIPTGTHQSFLIGLCQAGATGNYLKILFSEPSHRARTHSHNTLRPAWGLARRRCRVISASPAHRFPSLLSRAAVPRAPALQPHWP